MSEVERATRPLDSFLLDAYLGFTCCFFLPQLVRRIENVGLSLLPTILVFGLLACWRAGHTVKQRALTATLLFLSGTALQIASMGFGLEYQPSDSALYTLTVGISIAAGMGMRMLFRKPERSSASVSLLACSTILAAVLILTGPDLADHIDHPMIDRQMPVPPLKTMDGQPVDTSAWKGHVLVLEFWATSCGPCKREIPLLEAVEQRFHGNSRVQFVLADTGRAMNDDPNAAKAYLQSKHVAIPSVVWDGDRESMDGVLRPLGDKDGGIPALVVIDKRGHVRWFEEGLMSETQFTRRLGHILNSLDQE